MSGISKNDRVWRQILDENPEILKSVNEKGFFDVSSDFIRQYREPRLACYIDFREHRPISFRDHKLSILATANGKFRLARTDPFVDFSLQENVRSHTLPEFKIPNDVTLLSPDNLSSESKALDAALVSGILDEVFEDEVSLVIRGREFSTKFSFSLPVVDSEKNELIKYEIDRVQIEVDGGYEGSRGLYLVEAKCTSTTKRQTGMNSRQLLYPHLNYASKSGKKPVSTYLMLFEPNTRFYLFYRFHPDSLGRKGDNLEYRYKCQLVADEQPNCNFKDLLDIQVVEAKTEISAPFPQADRFERVIDAYRYLVANGPTERDRIISDNLDPRQFDYYINTLIWMKLARKTQDNLIELTNLGLLFGDISRKQQLFELARIVVSNDVFHAALRDNDSLAKQRMRKYRINSQSTIDRRMKTVNSWLKFFEEMLD